MKEIDSRLSGDVTDGGVSHCYKIKRWLSPLNPTVLGNVVHDRPLPVKMITQPPESLSCIMHLLPSTVRMHAPEVQRGRKDRQESQTHGTNGRRQTYGMDLAVWGVRGRIYLF